MCKFIWFFTTGNLLENRLILEFLEIWMIGGYAAGGEEFNDTGIGQRVEVAAEQELNTVRVGFVSGPEAVTGLLEDALQLVRQHHRLDELHVAEFRVPVDVSRADENRLIDLVRIRWQTWKTHFYQYIISI